MELLLDHDLHIQIEERERVEGSDPERIHITNDSPAESAETDKGAKIARMQL